MSGAGFILAINLVVAGLLAAAFLAITVYDRRRVAGVWMAVAYGLMMIYFGFEFVIATLGRSPPVLVATFSVILAALLAMNVALAMRYAERVPWKALAILFAVSVAANIATLPLPRVSFAKQMLYQLPFFMMGLTGAYIVLASRRRRLLDNILIAVLVVFALQFAAKPFIALAVGGTGTAPGQYITTVYAQISQSLGTVFVLALALLMFVILMRDIAEDLDERSAIDELSGLYNRRGFEQKAKASLQAAAGTGLPVSLVICDLDRFKAVNDTYGHAVGDNAIVVFSQTLRRHMREHDVGARIGGEEFSIILPATNIGAARLFAESVRASWSEAHVDGLPEHVRLTASFGVAEMMGGEHYSEFMRRADQALYKAKRGGRDQVAVAPSPANDIFGRVPAVS